MKQHLTIILLLFAIACTSRRSANSNLPLRVMSYNIHHANPPSKPDLIDLKAIAVVINIAKPDVVALQEIDVNTTRSGKNINEAEELARLTGMKAYFAKAIDYGGGEYGVAMLSKLPVSNMRNIALPTDPATKGERRTLGLVNVQAGKGREVVFAFTHLDAQGAATNRLLQMQKINELLGSEKRPVILAGDLNAVAGSEVINILDKEFQRSCVNNCGFTIPEKTPTKTIDFIAFRPKNAFRVVSHEVIAESYASDHRPVFAILQ